MEYKWKINSVQVAEGNLIVKVDLLVTGTDGKNSASAAYTRTLTRGDSFVPYEELTEQQVLDWCFAPEVITWTDKDNVEQSITKHLKDEGEAQVTGQIERQLAQKAAEPALPWANVEA
jgi:hypothetical protein